MAVWITKKQLKQGEAMGAQNRWTGVGIFFDTHANGNDDIPSAQIFLNYNNKNYLLKNDGVDVMAKSCYIGSMVNTPFTMYLNYSYEARELSMDLQLDGKQRVNCFHNLVYKVDLGNFISVSAMTSPIRAEEHHIYSLELKDSSVAKKAKKVKSDKPKKMNNRAKVPKNNKKYTADVLREGCSDDKCLLTKLYNVLGEVSREITKNINAVKEKNEKYTAIVEKIKKIEENQVTKKSLSSQLRNIKERGNEQIEKISKGFSTVGDLTGKIQDMTDLVYSRDYEVDNGLTFFHYFILLTQFAVVGALILVLVNMKKNQKKF